MSCFLASFDRFGILLIKYCGYFVSDDSCAVRVWVYLIGHEVTIGLKCSVEVYDGFCTITPGSVA